MVLFGTRIQGMYWLMEFSHTPLRNVAISLFHGACTATAPVIIFPARPAASATLHKIIMQYSCKSYNMVVYIIVTLLNK